MKKLITLFIKHFRATRGRALSLCLLTSPLEFQNWEYENKTHKNGSCSYTDESGENSTVNSEDEGVSTFLFVKRKKKHSVHVCIFKTVLYEFKMDA